MPTSFYPLPNTAPGVLTTAIFAMGDARYYSRLRVPATYTDAQILAIWQFLASYSAAAKIAVTKSIEFTPDGIPAADANVEFRAKILVGHADGSATQLEIPMLEPDDSLDLQSLADGLLAVDYVNVSGGSPVQKIVQLNRSVERRARGR